jgi:amino acid adenylation domain-containing protein
MIPEPQPISAVRTTSFVLPELVQSWNATHTAYPREASVAELFADIAAGSPDSIAVSFVSQQLSYGELNVRANRLAHRLRRMGVGAETLVGCCIERSLDLIVGLVAILKAGGAYVPLDPSYPRERLDYLLKDTNTPVMLTQKSLMTFVPADRSVKWVCVDDDYAPSPTDDDVNPALAGGPTSLAYVMYTSGSTGQPKGVMVENRAIVRLVRNTNFCNFGPEEVFLQFAPISFDASTLEIWGALLNGGRLVVMPPESASVEDLGQTIRDQGVTTLWLTAGLFNLIVEQRLEDLRPIRQLLAGGDVLSSHHVRTVLENFPDCTLINGYGPTENTTFTCCHAMRAGGSVPDSIPIGRPISNTRVYILDEQMHPLQPGEAGELYAAGDGVARGYLNNPEATAEKFVADPFHGGTGGRMYRTGDLARWYEDGTVEFLGRIDNQVKINGHRIEPAEIEAAMRSQRGVEDVCVVAHADGNGSKRLVAYYVSSTKTCLSVCELRENLASKLPQFMVPALFVAMDSLPLSPNGKVDRAALPVPLSEAPTPTEPSKTMLEQSIADLWKRILLAQFVGLDENFFDLGGDSLLLLAVHSNLQKMLHVEIPVTDLFEFTTVRTLARHLEEPKPAGSSLGEHRERAQKQRDAFTQSRERRALGAA